ncbi:MAG: carboxypeptidase-like regulatory domain-containing protein [Flavobacteriaceae bacterium]|jgi:hypothetical protein|nr:carboxypeptidase-like regulatory domain-containing protein [Flavobacteriaceae bacterium]
MKKIIICFVGVLFSASIVNARVLEGVVLDKKTNKPVQNALVYLDRTSFETATNADGKFRLDVNNMINTVLVISHLAYGRVIIPNPFKSLPKVIYLEEEVEQLEEVTISAAKNKYTRKQMMKVFRRQFLGASKGGKECKILNENDIVLLYNDDNTLTAYSDVPVEIANPYLGYDIRWEIIEFKVKYKRESLSELMISSVSIIGTASLNDIAIDDNKIQQRREDIYSVSPRYFFNLLSKRELDKSNFYLHHKGIPYPPEEMFTVVDDTIETSIKHITINPKERNDEGKTVVSVKQTFQIGIKLFDKFSQLFFLSDAFSVDLYGNTDLIKGLLIYGEMSTQRIGDMLPLNYGN